MTALEIVLRVSVAIVSLGLTVHVARHAWQLEKDIGRFLDAKEARIAVITHRLDALLDDHLNPNRDSIYKHDLHALLKDGAKDGCHTDVGTALRKRLLRLQTEADNGGRPAGCLCQWEQGDSPCPVHGEDEGKC